MFVTWLALRSDLRSGFWHELSMKGLKTLIKALSREEVERLVINHKDRLLRFSSELIFSIGFVGQSSSHNLIAKL